MSELLNNFEDLKAYNPEFIEMLDGMSKEELYKQCIKESIDAVNMDKRVELFMSECTSMSSTYYTLEVIKELIDDERKDNIKLFCVMALMMEDKDDIVEFVREIAEED